MSRLGPLPIRAEFGDEDGIASETIQHRPLPRQRSAARAERQATFSISDTNDENEASSLALVEGLGQNFEEQEKRNMNDIRGCGGSDTGTRYGVRASERLRRPCMALRRSVLAAVLLCCWTTHSASGDLPSASPAPLKLKIAVFPLELEDISAAGKAGTAPSTAAYLAQATEEAKRALLRSGRYIVIDPAGADALAAGRDLRDCHGCEAAIARRLAADQALVGVILRPEMVEYGAKIWITDARDGRVISTAILPLSLGGAESWPSGVRLLMPRLLVPKPSRDRNHVP